MQAEANKLGRRDFLRTLAAGAGMAATPVVAVDKARATENDDEKRKARYKADSPDVQAYYRVNRYPS
jgi:hypothetical protein